MAKFRFRCGEGHVFKSEGNYSQFDIARPCLARGCESPAFMIVESMAPFNGATIQADRDAYMSHNITFTGGDSEVQHRPNEHALQCACDSCIGHRKRASVTETAEPMRRNKRVAKEVRA
jgi:hypothetical protein